MFPAKQIPRRACGCWWFTWELNIRTHKWARGKARQGREKGPSCVQVSGYLCGHQGLSPMGTLCRVSGSSCPEDGEAGAFVFNPPSLCLRVVQGTGGGGVRSSFFWVVPARNRASSAGPGYEACEWGDLSVLETISCSCR